MEKYTELVEIAERYCDPNLTQLSTHESRANNEWVLAKGVMELYEDLQKVIDLADGWIISADATGEYGDESADAIYEALEIDPYFRNIP